jgi:ATP:ADP antiporter, AAA family
METLKRLRIIEALLGALYFFLVLCAYHTLKPLRDSSFLTEFHPHAKPLFNLITMILLFIIAGSYSWIVKKVPGKKFLTIFYSFIVLNLILFWLLFKMQSDVAGALFYTWLSTANVFMITIFWTQINSTHIKAPNHWYYIIVGLGGTIGAALGGKITSLVVPIVGSNNLIFIAIVIIALAYTIGLHLSNLSRQQSFVIPPVQHETANFKGLLKEQYAICILVLVVIGTFVQSIYDYQLTVMVSENIKLDKDTLSIFYGDLYFKMNTFAFFAQLILGPLLMMTLGPARGLYLFVGVIMATSLTLSFNYSLPVMEWVFIIFAGTGYSLVQVFREQLYIPASEKIKVSYKGFIDTFGFRAGDSLAAVAFVVVVSLMGFEMAQLDVLVFISALIAAYFLYKANRIYEDLKGRS